MSTINMDRMTNAMRMENGDFGMVVAESTTPVLEDLGAIRPNEYYYGVIFALADASLDLTVRPTVYKGAKSFSSFPLLKGEEVRGRFDMVTVKSGKVRIYYGKDPLPTQQA